MVEGSSPPARMGGSPAPRQQQVRSRETQRLSLPFYTCLGVPVINRDLSQGLLPPASRALAGGLLPAT